MPRISQMTLARIYASVFLLSASMLSGDVVYRQAENVILVTGFSEECPATTADLVSADGRGGWGKVVHDRDTGRTRVSASLWIGTDADLGTYFQLGRSDCPCEELIVAGDVWVRPARDSAVRTDGRPSVTNRLRLGDPEDPSIRGVLKIDCSRRREFGISLGLRRGASVRRNAELHAFNSTITAATPDLDHALRGYETVDGRQTGWYASNVTFINSTLSWIDGDMMYGAQAENSTLVGSTFEHGGSVLKNGQQLAKGCVFRNLQIAVAEGGCLNATLIRCTFADNARNWTLGSLQSGGITMIDCVIGRQQRPVQLRRNKVTPEYAARRGIPIYPCVSEWRSLVVRVVSEKGDVLPDAFVNVSCEQDETAVRNGFGPTDALGQTPSDSEHGAILLRIRMLRATDDPEHPLTRVLPFAVSVHARGYRAETLNVDPATPIPEPLVVALEPASE